MKSLIQVVREHGYVVAGDSRWGLILTVSPRRLMIWQEDSKDGRQGYTLRSSWAWPDPSNAECNWNMDNLGQEYLDRYIRESYKDLEEGA